MIAAHPAPDGAPVLSVVVPLYNEEAVLAQTHACLAGHLRALGETYEIVFVDDGSTDGSRALVAGVADVPAWGWAGLGFLAMWNVQFLCLAVLGEYVVRTHRHTQRRPLYVVDEMLGAPAAPEARSAA